MKELICPVCSEKLDLFEKTYKCKNNHCFDISKYGVTNLSLNNKSSKKRHGDDKIMVIARKEFLDNGYYSPINKAVVSLVKKHNLHGILLDAGCGEGYYTSSVDESMNATATYGIDISKDALRYFKKRLPNATAIVSSIFKMPIKTNSIDVVLNMFAPLPADEFSRVLKKDGALIRTFVLENHLIELKQAVYDNAYLNEVDNSDIDGFKMIDSVITKQKIHILGENIKNLFLMTPYYYKTSQKDQQKLESLKELDTTIEVMTAIYKKL